jgi:hypothetical protein
MNRRVRVGLSFPRLASGLLLALLLAGFALVAFEVCLPARPLGDGWPPVAVLLLLAVAATLAAQAKHLPGQNVALASTMILLLAGLALAAGVRAGIPLVGPITGPAGSADEVLHWLPWGAAFWLLGLLTSRGVARLILRPRRASFTYGFQVLGLTVFLFVLFNLASQPLAPALGHSRPWQPGRAAAHWPGTPCIGLGAQALAALVILTLVTPWLIDKRQTDSPAESYPLMIWTLANLLFTVAALAHQAWGAAALAALGAALVTPLGLRGAASAHGRGTRGQAAP